MHCHKLCLRIHLIICILAIPFVHLIHAGDKELGAQDYANAEELARINAEKKQIIKLVKKGKLAEAATGLTSILPVYERLLGSDHRRVASCLNDLGIVYYKQEKYAEAKPLHKRALAIRENKLGPHHKQTAYSSYNLGLIYLKQADYSAAENTFQKALAIMEDKLGAEHQETALCWNNLGLVYLHQGRYSKAETSLNNALKILNKNPGPDHHKTAMCWNNFGNLYKSQGKYAEAESAHKKALAIREKTLGSGHQETATSWSNLGLLYDKQGRYSEAETALNKALSKFTEKLGSENRQTAMCWNNLGNLYRNQGKYQQAEEASRKALQIKKKKLGLDHPDTAANINDLGLIHQEQGRYTEAEEEYKKSLKIIEEKFGIDHAMSAKIWNNLGNLYRTQGKYLKAEEALLRALTIKEKRLGADHTNTAESWLNLATIYLAQGNHLKAEEINKKALAILEKKLGPDHPNIAIIWSNFGIIYRSLGRLGQAEEALLKSLKIKEKKLGPDHTSTADTLVNIGNVYLSLKKYPEAEEVYKKALEISEKKRGAKHSDSARIMNNLGTIYRYQGKFPDAEMALKRALATVRDQLGAGHPGMADGFTNIGNVYQSQGKYFEAKDAFLKALEIREKKFGADHQKNISSKASLARVLLAQQKQESTKNALHYIRQASSRLDDRFVALSNSKPDVDTSEERTYRWIHAIHLNTLARAQDSSILDAAGSLEESFIVSQRATNSTVAKAISKMAARVTAGHDTLEDLALQQQETIDRLTTANTAMMKAYMDDKSLKAERHRATAAQLTKKLAGISSSLTRDYPEFVELSNGRPVPLRATQSLLEKDEVLVAIILCTKRSYLWAMNNKTAQWWVLPLGKDSVANQVRQLRSALDLSAITNPADIPRFPLAAAKELYMDILQPAEEILKGSKRIFVVADGPLQSIPFGVLVQGGKGNDISYQETDWLAREYAFAYLPSVSSLKALRTLGKKNNIQDPFLGFGDPLLGGQKGELRVASLFDNRGTGLADIRGIRQLTSLPETAGELANLAKTLGAPSDSVHLRDHATETKLKNMDVSNAQVLAFATHGLLAGDFEFLGEPALVLTPPDEPTEEDDGLLTASEVARLKLNADWVILSACNTAASDGTPGGEGFSGLAKSFFYAGAKTLLVSHWPVESSTAKQLTTNMFKALKNNPSLGKAEALKQARLEMIDRPKQSYQAHPAFWAPFVVVGEARTAM